MSNQMLNLWSQDDYKQIQAKKLKISKKDIYKNHPEYLEKISIGNSQTWEEDKDNILKKQYETKTKNKSWNSSKLEKNYYEELLKIYPENDIKYQYSEDPRYPFNCDFYIKSKDLFIEIQGTWCHGGHPFNEFDPEDQQKLNEWKIKAEKSIYYRNAIKVWTIDDPLKFKIAKENNLNIEFIY